MSTTETLTVEELDEIAADDSGDEFVTLCRDDYGKLLAAARQSIEAAWEPIETAPKTPSWTIMIAYKAGPAWIIRLASWNGEDWRDAMGNVHYKNALFWRPLPPAPPTGTGEQK